MLGTTTAISTGTTTGTTTFDNWNYPVFIKAIELKDSIEFIYKQTSKVSYLSNIYSCILQDRVFKIVFSCKNGKWNKSEPIYGKIIPATDEYYEFD